MNKDYSPRVELFKEYIEAVNKAGQQLTCKEIKRFRNDSRYSASFESLIKLGNALVELPKDLEWRIKEIILKKIIG